VLFAAAEQLGRAYMDINPGEAYATSNAALWTLLRNKSVTLYPSTCRTLVYIATARRKDIYETTETTEICAVTLRLKDGQLASFRFAAQSGERHGKLQEMTQAAILFATEFERNCSSPSAEDSIMRWVSKSLCRS